MSKTIRIKDIAEKAGVSIGTVDRVLHNRGEVKKATKEKVMAIAEKLNYKPNIAARALKSPTNYKIAVLLPLAQDDNIFWSKHPIGIENGKEAIYPFACTLEFFYYEMHNPADFLKQAAALLEWQANGVILAPILKNESLELCGKLDDLQIPFVFIDTNIEGTNSLSFVGEDAYQAGRVAASLIDTGISKVKDILIVNIAKNLENVQHLNLRNQGFQSYFMDAGDNNGLKISIEIPDTNPKVVKEKLDQVFKNNPNIGGVFVSSSRTFVIADYLQKNNRSNLFLVGYELFGKNSYFLQQRVINFLIGQRPMEQAEKTFRKLFDFMAHNAVPDKKDYQPIDIINTENMDLV
ncbi:LacI family DNA-binding transcriptional regulator [Labilibacter marinus]|uniref:LacI family DNA-binding transcriptional regulator n=1 Tax=Labilibacter marinus TaxID=1477105 RepID=UPI00082AB42D|nr:LacI family DNA-binding transcriptional regulator [Labilibacter marinus]